MPVTIFTFGLIAATLLWPREHYAPLAQQSHKGLETAKINQALTPRTLEVTLGKTMAEQRRFPESTPTVGEPTAAGQ